MDHLTLFPDGLKGTLSKEEERLAGRVRAEHLFKNATFGTEADHLNQNGTGDVLLMSCLSSQERSLVLAKRRENQRKY